VPQHYSLRTGNLADGMGEKDLPRAHLGGKPNINKEGDTEGEGETDLKDQVADALLNDGYADGEDARGMLQGTTFSSAGVLSGGG